MSNAVTRTGSAIAILDPIEDEVMEWIAEGASHKEIAAKLGVHRNSITNWIKAGGEERERKHAAALEAKAEWHIDESGEILQDARNDSDLTPSQASIVRDQAKRHMWLAEKLNRRVYGEQPMNVNVGLNFGSLHLDALRQAGSANQIPVIEAKEITDGA